MKAPKEGRHGMSAGMTRRGFVGGLVAAVALPPAAAGQEDWFQDLEADRYYVLQGGPYKDTGGWGCPYAGMGDMLVEMLKDSDHCRVLDDRLAKVEQQGFYLTPSQYFGKPWRRYDRIYLTERWMREFYRRHRDDTPADWDRRYDEYRDALLATGWRHEYDRMSREELVAIGWKGVDIYRKEG